MTPLSDPNQPHLSDWKTAVYQKQFLDVISRDEADVRFREHLKLNRIESEEVSLSDALHRILSDDVVSRIDVPGFDRSNVDGFAIQSADTAGAREESPRFLTVNAEVLSPGFAPRLEITAGTATPIATGGMVPRGADAVIMIEHTEPVEVVRSSTEPEQTQLRVFRSAAAGQFITAAGTDISRGETILRTGAVLSSREIGVLAALGLTSVSVKKRPRVAVISTGNEIVPPGEPLPLGSVYDSNASILTAALLELGCEPVPLGTVRDDVDLLRSILQEALGCDAVLLSGGTSKGAGDLSYCVVSELADPGIVAHGVALKPGKPICLAVTDGKPVVVLPGFPTSAIFTFHEFVAPVLLELSGQPPQARRSVEAKLPLRINSDRGRTEYLLVSLIRSENGLTAWPMGKGSGSVTTFSQADGFIRIDQHTEMLDQDTQVPVQLLGSTLEPADLVVIGSHCIGLDLLLGELRKQGITSSVLHVGSQGGAAAARRGECDLAGVHLMETETGEYNRHLLTEQLDLVEGYGRRQGLVFREGDAHFEGALEPTEAVRVALADSNCSLINRNTGSGTRILIDNLLGNSRPPGYLNQTKSHNAVATAIAQKRADWGVAIDTVAREYELEFLPIQAEHYDFLIPRNRRHRPAVQAFVALLNDPQMRDRLTAAGFQVRADPGQTNPAGSVADRV
ncbi:MAG: molybdopterin biosynthesis protein [Planctomycetaceae bacterium]